MLNIAGKSAAVHQFVESLSTDDAPAGLIEIRGASLSPIEMADISYVDGGKVKSAPQDYLPTNEKVKAGECPRVGVIFLDEMGDAMLSVQSSLQRLLLDRKLGSVTLADGWHCMAATNRAKDKAAAGRISTALLNRCMTATLEPDADATFVWGQKNDMDYRVLAFMRFRPDCVADFDPSRRTDNLAFCSPRSLEITSDALAHMGSLDTAFQSEIINGILGDGVGSEFSGFMRIMNDLPNLDDILKDPENYKIPDKVDVSYATIGALTNRASKNNLSDIMKYFIRFGTELAVVAVKDLAAIHPAVFQTKEFRTFSSDNIKFAI